MLDKLLQSHDLQISNFNERSVLYKDVNLHGLIFHKHVSFKYYPRVESQVENMHKLHLQNNECSNKNRNEI